MWDLCVNVNPEALIQPRQWEKTENGQNLQNLRCRSAHCLQPVIPVPLYEGGGGRDFRRQRTLLRGSGRPRI